MSVLRSNQVWEMRKAETISASMHSIFSNPKATESLVEMVKMIRDVFKAQKCTLFVVDVELQKVLKKSGSNCRRVLLGGSD
jgi:hypothetical protein